MAASSPAAASCSALGIRTTVHGRRPAQGLVVANHLSYLDIADFQRGHAVLLCLQGGDRPLALLRKSGAHRRHDLHRSPAAAPAPPKSRARSAERLKLPVPVLLFPEGTSSDGAQVLRFHSSLFEPAVAASAPVTAAAVRYVLDDGARGARPVLVRRHALPAASLEGSGRFRFFRRSDVRRAAGLSRPPHGGGGHAR